MGITSAQMVVGATLNILLLIWWVSVLLLHPVERKGGKPHASIACATWVGGLQGARSRKGRGCFAPAWLQGGSGVNEDLGYLTFHLELPLAVTMDLCRGVEGPRDLTFFRHFIGFFKACTPRKRILKVAIQGNLVQRNFWVYLTERGTGYTQSSWNKERGFLFEGIHCLESGTGHGVGYEGQVYPTTF